MLRTIQVCERNVWVEPPRIVSIPAGVATLVFPDEHNLREEIVTRYIQNQNISVGDGGRQITGGVANTDPIYLSFGVLGPNGEPICDNLLQYHVVIQQAQLFDCFPHRKCVCAYCVSNTSVSTVRLLRVDMGH